MLQYVQSYRNFLNSRYLTEAFRISAGILLPAIVMSYFDQLAIGIVLAVGALCVSSADSPGPVHHRRNGMAICIILIFIVALISALAVRSPFLLAAMLLILTFSFSMTAVYGARGGSVGLAAMLVMILNLQHPLYGKDIFMNAAYISTGGVWYMIFSLALQKIRPYKLIQQILGDSIQFTAAYLKLRASFYELNADYDVTNKLLLQQQAKIQEAQTLVSELLFKTRTILKESTHTGRILVMIYLDSADLFESVMTSYQQYQRLHQYFDATTILQEIKHSIANLANELHEIGTAVKSGTISHPDIRLTDRLKKLREHFNDLRVTYMSSENVDGFLNLGKIIGNVEDLNSRILHLHHYTTYDKKIKRGSQEQINFESHFDQQKIKTAWFVDNLTLSSSIFRHSLRVSIAVLTGYLISLPLHLGHSYWILLTIVVIMKPAYSLTKTRNKDRLIGTFIGIVIGVLILFVVHNNHTLFAILILFMVSSYFFMRTNYFMNVLLMTPYLVLFFHMLYPKDFKLVLSDRLIDTLVGSIIAFLASTYLMPAWERNTIKNFMINVLQSNTRYYQLVANCFIPGTLINNPDQHVARRHSLVALANISDAFSRMLSEPKRQQKGIEDIHKFVVLNHTLSSHIATLSYYLKSSRDLYRSEDFKAAITDTITCFNISEKLLDLQPVVVSLPAKSSIEKLESISSTLLTVRQQELNEGKLETDTKNRLTRVKSVVDQFNYIYAIGYEIYKVSAAVATLDGYAPVKLNGPL